MDCEKCGCEMIPDGRGFAVCIPCLHKENNGRRDENEVLFFENETHKHQLEVARGLMAVASLLLTRAAQHDESKLESPERETFIRVTPRLKGLTYGSPEYKEQIAELGDALHHHYCVNRHHPEFFNTDPAFNGVDEMTLIDVVEMFCDWLAATKRHADGDIFKSIVHNQDRFRIDPQLARIFRNTAIEFGFEERP